MTRAWIPAAVAGLTAVAAPGRTAAEPPPSRPEAIRIDVVLVEHTDGKRQVVAGSRIEGRAGTDFDVEFTLDGYVLTGHFLTDLAPQRALEVTAHVVSRRLHGRSERGLPLWEEDQQDRTLVVGFDESIVLWPFGRDRNALAIEITPAPATAGPLRIEPFPPGRGGALRVRARRVPHRLVCEASVVQAGRELAHAVADCRLGRLARLLLGAGAQDRTLAVHVEDYQRDRPTDSVTMQVDLTAANDAPILHAMGTAPVGQPLQYVLDAAGTELRISARLADGESAD